MASLAIIPARGGSKRIPRKNVRLFAGRPMIAYAIDAARRSGLFDRVIVSTDDGEITAAAVEAGAEVPFMRPADLSDDHTPTVPVIAHAVAAARGLGWAVERACCIYPCAPLLDPADLTRGLDLLETSLSPYTFPVVPFPSPIQRALRRDADGATRPFNAEDETVRTQDLDPAFYDAGQFYWGTAEAWLAGLGIHSHAATIVLPEWRVVDIDTPDDWRRAEMMFAAMGWADGAALRLPAGREPV